MVWPSTTLPKPKLAGETASPGCAANPLRGIVKVEFDASLRMVIDPVTLPVVVGSNVTESVAVCDGLSVAGAVTPVALNPVPRADTLVI